MNIILSQLESLRKTINLILQRKASMISLYLNLSPLIIETSSDPKVSESRS